jgi:glutathione S-transferase
MITVWGRRNSANVQKVMWAIGELRLAYERHNVGGTFGGVRDPGYLAMNPNALVPTIRDGDLVLFESNAIVRYLAARYPKRGFWPRDPRVRAAADKWIEWFQNLILADISAVFFGIARTARAQHNLDALKPALQRLAERFPVLDQALGSEKFVAGGKLTYGDMPLGVHLHRYFSLPIERPSLPALEPYYRRLAKRPAYREHVAFPFGNSLEEWNELERQGADLSRSFTG